MHYQCIKCDKSKDQCQCDTPFIEQFADDEDLEEIRKESENKLFNVSKDGKKLKIEMLNHEIHVLRPISLLENGVRMILTYLPVKTTDLKSRNDPLFSNRAFFVCTDRKEKYLLPFDHEKIRSNFSVNVLPTYNQARWKPEDLYSYLGQKEPSDPKELFEIHDSMARFYLEFPMDYDYTYYTLWNIATYFYNLFDSFPYNDYTGTKRAGKTKALEFQKNICYNAIMTADVSSSSTFRLIEGLGATLLLDETEQFSNPKNDQAQAVRILLNQGFLKDQYAIRSEGKASEGFVPVSYNLYAPKSLAHIKAFDTVLEDRCIRQLMRRSSDKKILERWIDGTNPNFTKIRNLCYRLFLDYGSEISNLQHEAKKLLVISGRELQLWTPIITLALFFEKHGCAGLVNAIREKTIESSESRQMSDEEDSLDLQIVKFLDQKGIELARHEEKDEGWITISKLYEHLLTEQEQYSINPKWFTKSKLTSSLYRLGFKRKRQPKGICWLITSQEVDDVKKRLGMMEPKQLTLPLSTSPTETAQTAFSRLDTMPMNVENVRDVENVVITESIPFDNVSVENVTNVVSNNHETTQATKTTESGVDD